MVPARMAPPPTTIITTPIAPMTMPPNEVTADMPVSVLRTFANRFSTPVENTRSSRSSAMYLTMRMPPNDSASGLKFLR